MGVIKNLMVRIGLSAGGYSKGMKDAGNTTTQTAKKIKEATNSMRKSASSGFSSSMKSVREYSSYVARTKQDHQVAMQSTERLKDKINQLSSTYSTITSATEGIDLSQSLSAQISSTEKELDKINAKIQKTQTAISKLASSKSSGKSGRMAELEAELEALMAESDQTAAHLRTLDQVAEAVGSANMASASSAGLKKLKADIDAASNELKVTQLRAEETGQKLKSMGVRPMLKYVLKEIGTAAAQAAAGGVKTLASGLKNLGGGVVRGIASIPKWLSNIGKRASSSRGGLEKMVGSIRNLGIASMGIRAFSSVFGEFRSIISSYISQNEALNASVTTLKNQMGEALAPAINMVMVAFRQLMPVVTAVSNAINSIFAALFGNISATATGITEAASAAGGAAQSLETYGFDQITKVSDNSGGGSGASTSSSAQSQISEQSALVAKLTNWIQQLKDAFKAGDWKGVGKIVGDGINSVFDSVNAIDVGAKIGSFANNTNTALNSAFATVNFSGIGAKIGQALTSAVSGVDWSAVGNTIGMRMTALPSVIIGFIESTDWAMVGQAASDCVRSALGTVTKWIASTDWLKVGQSAADLVANVDWAGIATELFTFFGTAVAAGVAVVWGFADDAVKSIKEYFTEKIQAAGGNVAQGLLDGIVDGLKNIGNWLNKNVVTPVIEWLKNLFGIHSPSTVTHDLGTMITAGFKNGITDTWNQIIAAVANCFFNLKTKISSGVSSIATNLVSGFNSMKTGVVGVFSGMWSGVKSWINTIIGGVESMANNIINGLNSLISSFNKIAVVGKKFGINLSISQIGKVSLPRLAEGTIVDKPTAAIIGEDGKEAIMPLERHTGWITQLAQALSEQTEGGKSGLKVVIPIYFGRRKIAEYVIQDINEITRTTGTCPIHV